MIRGKISDKTRITGISCHGNLKHGHGRAGNRTPSYVSWYSMIQRCENPGSGNWKYYGGRGIRVCDRWLSFENFLADMGERPAAKNIDRIENNGNYEPNNCRWATQSQQIKNRRINKQMQAGVSGGLV